MEILRIARRSLLSFFVLAVFLALAPSNSFAANSGKLRVGAARVEITSLVTAALPPTGKYDHEKIYVRAIVIDNGSTCAAILGADSSDMYEAVYAEAAPKIAAELKCPVANILMSVTHSHSAGSPMGAAIKDMPYMQGFADALLDAARKAKAQLQPAVAGFGTGTAYLNVNRDAVDPDTHLWSQAPNTKAVSDKTVAVLKFVKPSGEPIAVYVNYAMHPIDGFLLGFITADFPGAMCRYVEQAFIDKAVVIFTQSASGDQNPLYLRPSTNGQASMRGIPITGYQLTRENVESTFRNKDVPSKPIDPVVRERLERFIESEGQILGEEVIRVMTVTTQTSDDARIWGAQKTITCPGRKRLDNAREGTGGSYEDAPPVPIRLGVLAVGNVALTEVNAEVYNRIALRTKSQSPLANTVFVALANGRADTGYIPDDESYGHQTFQVLGTKLKQGCAEDAISNTLADLIAEYTRQ
jgi:hypothetical protein